MPEKEQRKERKREEETEHVIRTVLEERRVPSHPHSASHWGWDRKCSGPEKEDVPF